MNTFQNILSHFFITVCIFDFFYFDFLCNSMIYLYVSHFYNPIIQHFERLFFSVIFLYIFVFLLHAMSPFSDITNFTCFFGPLIFALLFQNIFNDYCTVQSVVVFARRFFTIIAL